MQALSRWMRKDFKMCSEKCKYEEVNLTQSYILPLKDYSEARVTLFVCRSLLQQDLGWLAVLEWCGCWNRVCAALSWLFPGFQPLRYECIDSYIDAISHWNESLGAWCLLFASLKSLMLQGFRNSRPIICIFLLSHRKLTGYLFSFLNCVSEGFCRLGIRNWGWITLFSS